MDNQWQIEIQLLLKIEMLLMKRLEDIGKKIKETDGIEEHLNWGKVLAYEELLEEVRHKLGYGVLD